MTTQETIQKADDRSDLDFLVIEETVTAQRNGTSSECLAPSANPRGYYCYQ